MSDRIQGLDTNILSLLYNIERERDRVLSDNEESLADRDYSSQKLWSYFQHAAVAVSQLYKSCELYLPQTGEEELWLPFQNASLAITSLYREAIDSQKRRFDNGFRLGQKKRNKEIITWLSHYYHQTRRNKIRKDDLMTYLNYLDRKTGNGGQNSKSSSLSPQHYYSSPRGSYFSSSPSPSPNSIYGHRNTGPHLAGYKHNSNGSNGGGSVRSRDKSFDAYTSGTTRSLTNLPGHSHPDGCNKVSSESSLNEGVDLQTFMRALDMHGLNGAMSEFTMTSSPTRPKGVCMAGDRVGTDVPEPVPILPNPIHANDHARDSTNLLVREQAALLFNDALFSRKRYSTSAPAHDNLPKRHKNNK